MATEHTNSKAVVARQLRKEYRMSKDNTVVALDSVDFDMDQGEFVAIVGPSGSGKSTLLNILGTLDQPTSGTLQLAGVQVEQLKSSQLPDIRAHKIGFIFQEFNLVPTMSALENVAMGLKYMGVSKAKAKEKAKVILDLVGLSNRIHHKPRELSGGQQQRVAIARALVKEPAIILGDEPTGELDTKTSAEIVSLLKKINHERNIAMIMVTHNLEIAKEADRVITFKDGRIEQ